MKSFVAWEDKIVDKDKNPVPTYDVAFSPDGNQIAVATGTYVLIYDSATGNLSQTLRSHKEPVFAVDFSYDGKIFASGSADKSVIVWDAKTYEGLLRYSHNDTLQSISFNPQTLLVASCSVGDVALWIPPSSNSSNSSSASNAVKFKMNGRVLCSSWTRDGQFLALGTFSGIVSIRNRLGEEIGKIDRGSENPVWALSFNPKFVNILVIGDWGQTLSFHDIVTGKPVGKERTIDYDPCFISFFSDGENMLVGGSNKKVLLYNHEGIQLGVACDRKSGWVLSCRVRPGQNSCITTSKDGAVSYHQITFNTVHGLFQNRYAYRENLTDVIIHHLGSNQKARIKCRDLVKRISIYKSILAVQLNDRIIIYEQQPGNEIHYKIRDKINKKTECNLLVATLCNIILCIDSRLQLLDFKGNGELKREWNLQSIIRYIKVVGGPVGREVIFVGLKNGKVYYVYVDSPFPVLLIEHTSPIRCLDLSMYRKKVAIVDDNNVCFIYDIATMKVICQEPHASSVCFNSEYEDMFCYSGDGLLSIKTGSFAPYQQKFKGFVVGFKGSKVYCLNLYNMIAIDLPQTTAMDRYLSSSKDFDNAYRLASMGVTTNDWKRLGFEALENLRLDIAKQAFARVRELKYLDLVDNIERLTLSANVNPEIVLAEIHLYEGRIDEAAKILKKLGQNQRLVEIYTDLNMFDEAAKVFSNGDGSTSVNDGKAKRDILTKKAVLLQSEKKDLRAAAETYLEIGEYTKAIQIFGENCWFDRLIEVVRNDLNKMDTDLLKLALSFFRQHKEQSHVLETLQKMGDIRELVKLQVELHNWEEAFRISGGNEEICMELIFQPYSDHLVKEGKFVEAQSYLRKAGKIEESLKLLGNMTRLAYRLGRFDNASFYLLTLGQQCKRYIMENSSSGMKHLQEALYAYYPIFEFVEQPFTSYLSDHLFNMARFLMNVYLEHPAIFDEISLLDATLTNPDKITASFHAALSASSSVKISYILYTLARQGYILGAYRTASFAIDQLMSHYRVPPDWIETLERLQIQLKDKPNNVDSEDIAPTCYCCSQSNPILNATGNRCVHCNSSFVPSFYGFDNLPLVEFQLDPSISFDEAQKILDGVMLVSDSDIRRKYSETADSVSFSHDEDDPFTAQAAGLTSSNHSHIVLNRLQLSRLKKSEVFVTTEICDMKKDADVQRPASQIARFFRHIIPEIQVVLCQACGHFFHADDYEFAVLQSKQCPYCRTPI